MMCELVGPQNARFWNVIFKFVFFKIQDMLQSK